MLRPGELRLVTIGAALVVGLGLALGFGAGMVTRPTVPLDAGVERPPAGLSGPQAAAPGLPGWEEVYVNDYARLLEPDTEAAIRADLIELYDHTGIEMTVLTIPSRSTYGFDGTNEAFATALFNQWGIGNADTNDGVLVLVSLSDREMRIELGAGYPAARDADVQRVIDATFLPAFRRDDYATGIERGVEHTIRALTGVAPGQFDSGTLTRGWSLIGRFLAGLEPMALLFVLGLPAGGAVAAFRAYMRRRPRPCRACGGFMLRQREDVDDEHLDGGQRLEEYVRSVDYDVWECPSCNAMEITRHAAWHSTFGTCPSCSYRTLGSTTEVLESATTSREGRKRIDYRCEHCGHTSSETRSIPRRTESSSGSDRSSFGGGRSSGGGASGSW